jgi:tRNA(Arg) A34 adenosine deaminase TadA/pterin-4a-carbinolamine dehydratase
MDTFADVTRETGKDAVHAAMTEAIALARSAPSPFGAVLLDLDSHAVVMHAANSADSGRLTAHAETNLLRATSVDLSRCALVTTSEPCPMCATAAVFAGVAAVYYGSGIATLIKYGWPQIDISMQEVLARMVGAWPDQIRRPALVGGVLEDECDRLYADSARSLALLNDHHAGQYHAASTTTSVPSVDIDRRLEALPNWWLRDGRLHRSFQCATFEEAMVLINRMADLARRINHHPDFRVERKRCVGVSLWTHKLRALTTLDFDMAAEIEAAHRELTRSLDERADTTA